LHDGLSDDFASADMGHDVHTMSPARTIRKQISRTGAKTPGRDRGIHLFHVELQSPR
jgi:hypothetical protein